MCAAMYVNFHVKCQLLWSDFNQSWYVCQKKTFNIIMRRKSTLQFLSYHHIWPDGPTWQN
jgi:hypothetical protein